MVSYQSLLRTFHNHELKYLIVGGVAVNLHGYPRFTGDIDILLALDHANLATMSRLMEAAGYQQRLPVSIEELGDEKQLKEWIATKGLLAYSFINPSEPEFSIDVIVGQSLEFDKYDDRKILISIWGMEVPVISIDDLINMKKHSDREKDDSKKYLFDREYLRSCKNGSPEQRFRWLELAADFVKECQKSKNNRLKHSKFGK